MNCTKGKRRHNFQKINYTKNIRVADLSEKIVINILYGGYKLSCVYKRVIYFVNRQLK